MNLCLERRGINKTYHYLISDRLEMIFEMPLAEVDTAFLDAVLEQRFEGPRDVGIIYSPLHGVGATAVVPALKSDGFSQLEIFGPHAEPNGDFPNVPGNVSNPENPEVFSAMIENAHDADVILATDPDCDRLGAAAATANDGAQVIIRANEGTVHFENIVVSETQPISGRR